jgi:hypothetical protein
MSPHKKPYPPTTAGLGGQPTKTLDDPIIAVFIFLFVLTAATHMTILQVNLRRGQKFIMSGMLFGFCMARIVALSLRLALSTHLQNISLAIAAQIFVALGVILLFVINLIFTQRIIRASHPHIGWHKAFSLAFKIYYASIPAVIIPLVTCIVQSFYTLDKNILRIDRDIQRFGGTYFAVIAFMPLPLIAIRFILPTKARVDKFGQGRFRTKIMLIIFTSSLLTLGAAFRAGISYMPRPINNPAWYHSKACFYIFNFTIEWIVVVTYAIMRVDKRFIIPNKAHGLGSYSGQTNTESVEKEAPTMFRVLSEEEVFDGEEKEKTKSIDLEAQASTNTVANANH